MAQPADSNTQTKNSSVSDSSISGKRKDKHQLIVLGNGFDLAAGLPSSYSDFFKGTRHQVFPNPESIVEKSWGEHLRKQGPTAWDVILSSKDENSNWCDIESEIKKWVAIHPRTGLDRIEKVSGLLSGHTHLMGMLGLPTNWREYTGDPLTKYPEANVARFIIDTTPNHADRNWNRHAVLGILLDELHQLEARFMNYLSRAMDQRDDYPIHATDILCALEESYSPSNHDCYEATVLSFSYTMPYLEDGRKLPFFTQTVPIHGCLDDRSAIFGIDGTESLDDPDALLFTRTYHVMDAKTHDVTDIVFSPTSTYGRPTSIIKFFGHSLSEADYSYFQAIFDIVDLYNGNTWLVFYYRPYKDNDTSGAMARRETMQSVVRLLRAYGKTLDSKDHGKNLLHRLLIEQRLHAE